MVSALRVEEGSAAIGPVAGVSTRYLIKRLATMRLEGGTPHPRKDELKSSQESLVTKQITYCTVSWQDLLLWK
jgi:hypothetical protein